jgi:hypothetical protein
MILPLIFLTALFFAVTLLVLAGALLMALPILLVILFLITPMGFLGILSILSPTLFRVLVPPEVIEIAKRIALLPRDIARVINGLLHLPVDTMRAIAVLDVPVQTSGEVITYGEQQERIRV